LRLLGDRARAEDATQEVFVSLLPPDDGPDEIPTNGRAWLVRRALQAARDQLRSDRRRRAREAERADAARAEEEVTPAERAELRDAVARLPEPLRECVELRYFGGLPAREVGAALGLARRSVDERLAAARTRLRAELTGSAGVALVAALDPRWMAPHVDPSPALRARLDALALQLGGATAAGGVLAWTSGAGVVALAAVATLWDRSDSAVERARGDVQVTHDHEEDLQRPDGELEPVPVAIDRVVAAQEPRTAAAPLTPDDPAPAFLVEVVDEAGALVDSGTLVLTASSPGAGRPRPLGPSSGPWALGPRPFAGANPIPLPARPPELGNVLVQASAFAPGYGSAVPALLEPQDEVPHVVRLVLPAPQDLSLEVFADGLGDAVPDALVVAVSELERAGTEARGASTPVDGRFVVRTDALGRCDLVGLGGGRLMLEVHAEGYRVRQVFGLPLGGHVRLSLVPDASSASVTATVRGPDGAPVAGLDVHCAYLSMSGSSVVRTDASGVARFEGLRSGHRVVRLDQQQTAARAHGKGWPSEGRVMERRLYLGEGATENVALGFAQGDAAWHVELVDSDGRPVVGRHVTLRKDSLREGRTDETGHVAFEGLEPGAYYLSWGDRWQPGAHLVRAGETLRSRFVQGDRTLRGTVRLEDGTPVSGALLAFGDLYMESARTDEEGAFAVAGAPPGDYYVHVDVRGYPGVTTPVTVDPGLDPAPLDLVVPRGGTLRVRVDGAGARRLMVAAVGEAGRTSWLQPDPTASARYESSPLAPGPYTLLVREGRETIHETTVPVIVRAGETTEASLDLPH
ncbi:MAG: sigma-70 family RNA polymerase sigma factor, partial [Planctomycetota bacterium]